MENGKYVCSICGLTINGLDDYIAHVKTCGYREKIKLKAEQDKKYLEIVNAEISKVKAAKEYYETCLEKFKEKYPKEYEINFANEKSDNTEPEFVCYEQTLTAEEFLNLMNKLLGY